MTKLEMEVRAYLQAYAACLTRNAEPHVARKAAAQAVVDIREAFKNRLFDETQ